MTFNQYKEYSFDRIGKAQLSDENKLFIDKSMLERYRKYKCCVFIDFEYIEIDQLLIVVRVLILVCA